MPPKRVTPTDPNQLDADASTIEMSIVDDLENEYTDILNHLQSRNIDPKTHPLYQPRTDTLDTKIRFVQPPNEWMRKHYDIDEVQNSWRTNPEVPEHIRNPALLNDKEYFKKVYDSSYYAKNPEFAVPNDRFFRILDDFGRYDVYLKHKHDFYRHKGRQIRNDPTISKTDKKKNKYVTYRANTMTSADMDATYYDPDDTNSISYSDLQNIIYGSKGGESNIPLDNITAYLKDPLNTPLRLNPRTFRGVGAPETRITEGGVRRRVIPHSAGGEHRMSALFYDPHYTYVPTKADKGNIAGHEDKFIMGYKPVGGDVVDTTTGQVSYSRYVNANNNINPNHLYLYSEATNNAVNTLETKMTDVIRMRDEAREIRAGRTVLGTNVQPSGTQLRGLYDFLTSYNPDPVNYPPNTDTMEKITGAPAKTIRIKLRKSMMVGGPTRLHVDPNINHPTTGVVRSWLTRDAGGNFLPYQPLSEDKARMEVSSYWTTNPHKNPSTLPATDLFRQWVERPTVAAAPAAAAAVPGAVARSAMARGRAVAAVAAAPAPAPKPAGKSAGSASASVMGPLLRTRQPPKPVVRKTLLPP